MAEVGLFGFPEFHNLSEAGFADAAPTYVDAIQRPIYTDWSNRKVDVGNPMFGPISAIFTPSFVRNMTLIAPIDTGAWYDLRACAFFISSWLFAGRLN